MRGKEMQTLTIRRLMKDCLVIYLSTQFGVRFMKEVNTGPTDHKKDKHPQPLGTQQGVAEKAVDSTATVKARVDSKNMPDLPAMNRQNIPNSSGKK